MDQEEKALCLQVRELSNANRILKQERECLLQQSANLPNLQSQRASLSARLSSLSQESRSGAPPEDKELLELLKFEALNERGGYLLFVDPPKGSRIDLLVVESWSVMAHLLGSMQKGVLWFGKNNLTPGLLADGKALLQRAQPMVATSAQATKSVESQKKIDLETDLETLVVTSFAGAILPALVGGETGAEGGPFKVIYACQKSFAKWDPPGQGEGLKAQITAGTQ